MAGQRLNARLDEEAARKVDFLQRRTKQSVTQIVRSSVDLYYRHVAREAESRPADALAEFVGCAEGPNDLASTYKDLLRESLGHKA